MKANGNEWFYLIKEVECENRSRKTFSETFSSAFESLWGLVKSKLCHSEMVINLRVFGKNFGLKLDYNYMIIFVH